MLMSTFTFLVSAEDPTETTVEYTYNTSNSTPTMNYQTGEWTDPDTKELVIVDTEEEKLATMDLRMQSNGYQIYVDAYSGEVAVVCMATGEKLFTNPVTASAKNLEVTKQREFLSQILIDYIDITNNEQECHYNSFANAVVVGEDKNPLPSQILVKPIKNGIRVDYSIGRVDSRYLVPERISKVDFEEKIKNVILAALDEELKAAEATGDKDAIRKANSQKTLITNQLESFFKLYDLEDPAIPDLGSIVPEQHRRSLRFRVRPSKCRSLCPLRRMLDISLSIPNSLPLPLPNSNRQHSSLMDYIRNLRM